MSTQHMTLKCRTSATENTNATFIDGAGISFHIAGIGHEETSSRIVACVNACAGIRTETLELSRPINPIGYKLDLRAKVALLEQQRDELLEAIEQAVKWCPNGSQAQRILEEAIAKARGQQS